MIKLWRLINLFWLKLGGLQIGPLVENKEFHIPLVKRAPLLSPPSIFSLFFLFFFLKDSLVANGKKRNLLYVWVILFNICKTFVVRLILLKGIYSYTAVEGLTSSFHLLILFSGCYAEGSGRKLQVRQ